MHIMRSGGRALTLEALAIAEHLSGVVRAHVECLHILAVFDVVAQIWGQDAAASGETTVRERGTRTRNPMRSAIGSHWQRDYFS